MAMKALVTGAAGFVGAVVSQKLLDEGHDAHLLVRPESNPWRLEGLDAPRHAVELENEDALRRLLKDVRPEWVFHLAAHGSYSSQTDARRMASVNVLGTMNLVHAALEVGFEAMVNAGSSSEYGFTDHAPAEDERAEPNSHYALTKLSQTQILPLHREAPRRAYPHAQALLRLRPFRGAYSFHTYVDREGARRALTAPRLSGHC